MRIGLIAQPHDTGIGIQTWEFARHMNPAKVLITDLTMIHQMAGKQVERHLERFEKYDTRRCSGYPSVDDCAWLLEGIDVLFVVETPLNWDIFQMARECGVKTILQFNYEFFEYFPTPTLPKPDLLLAPSEWNLEKLKVFCSSWLPDTEIEYIPVPVATDRFKPRVRTKAQKFIHIAGHTTYADRNGTEIVKEAAKLVSEPNNSDYELFIYSQAGSGSHGPVKNYWDLYNSADVLLLPRHYGGLSLQFQEAQASGMPVIVGSHDPYAEFGISIPSSSGEVIQLRSAIETYDVDSGALARVIDRMVAADDISEFSENALQWAQAHSWNALIGKYQETMEKLCKR